VGAEGFKTIQDWSKDPKVKGLDPAAQFDNTVLKSLQDSGFAKTLESR
jgi:hypothetical protein